jgi:hypothetical protein
LQIPGSQGHYAALVLGVFGAEPHARDGIQREMEFRVPRQTRTIDVEFHIVDRVIDQPPLTLLPKCGVLRSHQMLHKMVRNMFPIRLSFDGVPSTSADEGEGVIDDSLKGLQQYGSFLHNAREFGFLNGGV